MVQLKSFRYIESAAELYEPQRGGASSSSSSACSRSISTLEGGNLTSEESQLEQRQQEFSSPTSNEDEEPTTLSSSDEYQVAKHEIIEEEEDEDEDEIGITRINIESEKSGRQRDFARSPGSRPKVGAQMTPRTPRHHLLMHGRQTSSPVVGHILRNQSPQLRALTPNFKRGQADSVSEHSFGQRLNQAQTSNHFEIRWRNINLFARKSKLPRAITENRIYKMFKRDTSCSSEKMYYSPPMKHKLNSALGQVGQVGPSERACPPEGGGASAEFRPILSDISGSMFSGQLTAILGPSGVGKTGLLNSLTGRNTLDGTGKVSLLGGGASKRMSVVTVPQADVLPAQLTALEDLRFTSKLKNPQSGFDHERNIERVVRHLQMEKFLNTRIHKLSGGETRRLSIARELTNPPDIMILDEPTSGLDANTCKKIIMALRDIVEHSDHILDRPMSIVVTIHQPQQEVLNLFHRLYVIAIGGRAIYEGPPSTLLSGLLEQSSLGSVCPVEELNENPAIVALEVASGEYGMDVIYELAVHHQNQCYEESFYLDSDFNASQTNGSPYPTPGTLRNPRKSPHSIASKCDFKARLNAADGRLTPIIGKRTNLGANQLDRVSAVTSVSYASSYDADLPEPTSRLKVDKRLRRSVVMKGDFISHTLTLMNRCWLLTTRDLLLMAIRIFGFILVAIGMVQIFSHALDPNEHQCPIYESEIEDMASYIMDIKERLFNIPTLLKQSSSTHLFLFHLILCITTLTSALNGLAFPLQMRMFMREYKNGWYSPASFITSQTLAELPVDMIGPTITILIIYPLCNQPASIYHWRELAYISVIIIASVICKSQAQIVGAFLMDSVENSVFMSCVAVMPHALLSGIAIRISQLSLPFQILSYGTFLRYTFESMLSVRYGYGLCPCDPETIHGYPIRASSIALPPQLDALARNILESSSANTTFSSVLGNQTSNSLIRADSDIDPDGNNLFLKFLRLVSGAGNMFVANPEQLGSCSKYRSLYLLDMSVDDNLLLNWMILMVIMFIVSRIVTYFVVKLVIKIRRNKRD